MSGAEIRQALAAHGVPGSRVDLFGATGGEVVVSEYDGEARLIQEPNPPEVADYELIFLCEGGEAAARVLALARPDNLVVDLAGCSRGPGAPPLVHLDINPDAAHEHRGILAVPHPIAGVIAEILHPIERSFGIRRAFAVLLRPASDFGEKGLEELKDQTVRLLRFTEPPKDVFGRQLAFNLIPQRLLGRATEPGLERRLAEEVARLLGWPECRLSLSLITVPVFYGHALSARVELLAAATASDVERALGSHVPSQAGEDGAGTPMEVAGVRQTTVSETTEDGLGGFWLWAVSGEAGSASAEQAVRLAGGIAGL